jgi:hypothetical protein
LELQPCVHWLVFWLHEPVAQSESWVQAPQSAVLPSTQAQRPVVRSQA